MNDVLDDILIHQIEIQAISTALICCFEKVCFLNTNLLHVLGKNY